MSSSKPQITASAKNKRIIQTGTAHVEKVDRKIAAPNGLVDEGRASLLYEEHGIGNGAEGFAGRVRDILVGLIESNERREGRWSGDDL